MRAKVDRRNIGRDATVGAAAVDQHHQATGSGHGQEERSDTVREGHGVTAPLYEVSASHSY